ncbi:hypothetical protein HN011_009808 [Eciton burchellii]|nr:hypothetical protein HN011_009808 [Eciton burchellii]
MQITRDNLCKRSTHAEGSFTRFEQIGEEKLFNTRAAINPENLKSSFPESYSRIVESLQGIAHFQLPSKSLDSVPQGSRNVTSKPTIVTSLDITRIASKLRPPRRRVHPAMEAQS